MTDIDRGGQAEAWADFRAAGLVVPGRITDTRTTNATMPDGEVVIVDVISVHTDGGETVFVPRNSAHINRVSPPRERRIR
jgi:hypothetical protein